ncbi:AMP-binding protein [Streptomyces capparidis]
MSLTAALRAVADRGSGHGIRLFNGGREAARTGFGELYHDAGRIACGLRERGVAPGERVALALPTSLDFPRALFGVLAAGAVPVPVPPPFRFASLDIHIHRIGVAMRRSGVTRVVSDAALGALLGPALGEAAGGGFTVLDVAGLAAPSPLYEDVAEGHPALVQYTSGTSEDPKGVVLSHGNLLANTSAISRALGLTRDDTCVSWLPLFHDMGLIGTLLTAALHDVDTCLMPPEDFLRDPGRWLRLLSGRSGAMTAAPNSGYLHALRRTPPEAVRELDLSGWRLALNGAEAVDAELMRRFTAHFAPAGLRGSVFLPVYGLAEGSLAVAFAPAGRPVRSMWVRRDLLGDGVVGFTREGAEQAREVVSVGRPVAGTEVRLVAEDGTVPDAEGAVGEIEIRGASVMRGYEADEAATARTVRDGGWLATGDLGFRHDGELYVTGRRKEMVIVFGQNHYASDIEAVAGRLPGMAPHSVLAGGVRFPEGEGLVLLVETREHDPAARSELVARVRLAVSGALGVTPRDVVLVRRGLLPRTSSGKLRRHGVEALYREHSAPRQDSATTVGRTTGE